MLFGKFRILGKLTLLVLVPLLGVVALAVPIVINRVDAARDAQRIKDTVELANAVGSAVQDLQEERLLSSGYFLGLVQSPDLVAQSAKVQDKLAALTRRDQPLNATMKNAVANAARLNDTRAAVLSRKTDPYKLVQDFNAVVQPLIDGLQLRTRADLTTSVGRQLYALDYALRTNDLISQSSSYLTTAAIANNPQFVGLFASLLIRLQNDILTAQVFFTPSQYKLYLSAQDAWSSRVGVQFLTLAATDPAKAIGLLNRDSLFGSLQSVNVLGGFVEKRVSADVNAAVTTNRDDALRTAYWVGGASLLLLLMVFGLSIVMARAVARPLQRLTSSADRIARAAETELERVADDEAEVARPIRLDPVDVAARDEIGDLARAFDRVQTTAVRLVERQVGGRRNVAQMFGHVGRRTQNLVGRQLALIDNLERRETDSDRLRELYRLDHMSSRLRRNASSLVVLSGGAGTNEHMAPLPLSDVVRLALGEIEDYTRVEVEVPEEIVVVPALVADLTLLLAELMENATAFSPPHTRVMVTAAELRGGARLAIVDHGLGLAPERLAEENARLTRRERLDLAPTEVLGLFVVGRLARRHGIEVTLTDTPEGGVTAWIDLRPAHLVPAAETLPPGTPIQAIVTSPTSEFGALLAGGVRRSAPGSFQPFDANVLDRATRTLQSAQTWNAFASPHPELTASATPIDAEIVDDVPYGRDEPGRPYDAGTPVAGRHPAAMPELLPVPIEMTPAPVPPPPAAPQRFEPQQFEPQQFEPVTIPRQRTGPEQPARNGNGNGNGLRRRVPGSQLPQDTGPQTPAAPPSTDDALAARAAFDAFEAGVTRAQWDVIEAEMTGPSADGNPPLARRVPGASLPAPEPQNHPPAASPRQPLDPDAARALVEQFEYGVALALNESKSQHEGQSR